MLHSMHIGHALREYKCSKCRFTFTSLGNLATHEKAKHNVLETEAPFKCNECNHPFILEEALNYHQKTEHGYNIESFDCDECDWKFFSKAASCVHKKMHHNCKDLKEEYFCSFCSQVCFSKKDTVKHYLDSHKTTRLSLYLCDNCEFSSSRISETKEHMRTQHNIDNYKPYICSICDLKWDTSLDFIRHNLRKHGEQEKRQKFICDLCGRALLSRTNLKKHKIVHSAGKEKNFVCDICGLATTTDWYLIKHKRQQHKPVKDVICEYCDKHFRRKEGRERHIDRKHPDSSSNNFTCPNCGKGFIFKSSFHVHMSQRHNTGYNTSRENGRIEPEKEKLSLQCENCDKAFSTRGNLKKHVLAVHEERKTDYEPVQKKLKSIQNTNKNGKKLGVPDGKNVKFMKVTKQPDGKLMCQLCKTIFDAMNDVVKHMPNCAKLDSAKGQLISTFPVGVLKSPPKTSKGSDHLGHS